MTKTAGEGPALPRGIRGLSSAPDPLGDKTRHGHAAIGLFINDPDMVELCAYLGFDWFMIDQMYSANDWSRTQQLIRAGESVGITPVVRVHSNPFLGDDSHVPASVARALALGARYVLVSNRGRRDVEVCLRAIHDWHRRVMVLNPFVDLPRDEFERRLRQMADETYVIPQPEARSALDEALDTLALADVRMLFVATGDASRELSDTGSWDWYDPKLRSLIERLVDAGRRKNAVIGASTGSGKDLAELAKRVEHLHRMGVRMILVQGAPYLFQLAITPFVRELRAIVQSHSSGHASL
jgi:4-hydroxy-2-oxoheptanedioate aldolase